MAGKYENACAIAVRYSLDDLCQDSVLQLHLEVMLWLYCRIVAAMRRWWEGPCARPNPGPDSAADASGAHSSPPGGGQQFLRLDPRSQSPTACDTTLHWCVNSNITFSNSGIPYHQVKVAGKYSHVCLDLSIGTGKGSPQKPLGTYWLDLPVLLAGGHITKSSGTNGHYVVIVFVDPATQTVTLGTAPQNSIGAIPASLSCRS